MKANRAVLFVLSLLAAAPVPCFSDEGGQTHGGTSVVCRNSDGSIASAELLDTFEARELYGLREIPVRDVSEARSALLKDLDRRYVGRSLYPRYLRDTLSDLHGRFKLLAPDVRLKLIPDAFPKIERKGCSIEQLAAFQEKSGEILLDSEIFRALDPTGRLTLELHESVYLLDRKWSGATNSVFSRKLVGLLLSDRWGKDLDQAIGSYSFGVPRAGKYLSSYGECSFRLEIGTDGSIRMTPDRTCGTVIPWDAFERSTSAILNPDGKPGEWKWVDREGGSAFRLIRVDDSDVRVENVPFRRVGG